MSIQDKVQNRVQELVDISKDHPKIITHDIETYGMGKYMVERLIKNLYFVIPNASFYSFINNDFKKGVSDILGIRIKEINVGTLSTNGETFTNCKVHDLYLSMLITTSHNGLMNILHDKWPQYDRKNFTSFSLIHKEMTSDVDMTPLANYLKYGIIFNYPKET